MAPHRSTAPFNNLGKDKGYDMWGFMAARLSVEAFELWTANGQFNGDLPAHSISR